MKNTEWYRCPVSGILVTPCPDCKIDSVVIETNDLHEYRTICLHCSRVFVLTSPTPTTDSNLESQERS